MKALLLGTILSLLLTSTFAKKLQTPLPISTQATKKDSSHNKSITFYLNQIKKELNEIEHGNLQLKEDIDALKEDTKGALSIKKTNHKRTSYKNHKKRIIKKKSIKKRTHYKHKKTSKTLKRRRVKLDLVDSITLTLERGMTAKFLAQKFYGNPSYARYIRETNHSFRVGDTIRIPGVK